MALEPDFVGRSWQLLQGAALSPQDADELARLLETREELFAYLFTLPDIVGKNPDIKAKLRGLAEEHGDRAATTRSSVVAPVSALTLVSELENELLKALASHNEKLENIRRIQTLCQRFVANSDAKIARTSAEYWIDPFGGRE